MFLVNIVFFFVFSYFISLVRSLVLLGDYVFGFFDSFEFGVKKRGLGFREAI